MMFTCAAPGYSTRQVHAALQRDNDVKSAAPHAPRPKTFDPTPVNHIPQVQKLQRACLRNPVKVEVASKYQTVDTLKQEVRAYVWAG